MKLLMTERANQLKIEGNEELRKGNYGESCEKYKKALNLVKKDLILIFIIVI